MPNPTTAAPSRSSSVRTRRQDGRIRDMPPIYTPKRGASMYGCARCVTATLPRRSERCGSPVVIHSHASSAHENVILQTQRVGGRNAARATPPRRGARSPPHGRRSAPSPGGRHAPWSARRRPRRASSNPSTARWRPPRSKPSKAAPTFARLARMVRQLSPDWSASSDSVSNSRPSSPTGTPHSRSR